MNEAQTELNYTDPALKKQVGELTKEKTVEI